MKEIKIAKYIIILMIVIIIGGYTYYQTKGFTRGPILQIDYPSSGMTMEDSLVEIRGLVKNASYITMNDRQIFVDENGKLKENILLSLGYNIIEIKVKDKYEREKKEFLELIYEPKQENSEEKIKDENVATTTNLEI